MKKTAFICIATLCMATACKKSNSGSGSNYHMTATIDGTAETFNVSPLAVNLTNSGETLISIEGLSSSSSSAQSLALGWNNNVPNATLGVGTYSDTATSYSTIGTYDVSSTETYICGSDLASTASSIGSTINHLKIVITSVDSTHIAGTFSGDFYLGEDLNGTIKTVTNGSFDVPWKK
ncbi:MAG TPA: hypothetical protein VGS79_26375 [Puia sp.]|nr:hypothetical protein [Puia sp.]